MFHGLKNALVIIEFYEYAEFIASESFYNYFLPTTLVLKALVIERGPLTSIRKRLG